jgi:predicted RecA/RadA family phage recombinase
MKNFLAEGRTITVTAPVAVLSGQLIAVGKINGVCGYDAASGAPVEVSVEGVFSLPKTPGDSITAGQAVRANASGVIDAAATVLVGYATAAAGAGTSVVSVRLCPSAA